MPLTVRAHRDPAGFDALRPEWNVLLARSRSRSTFLTWEWLRVWWRHFGEGRDLWLLEARDDAGTLVGIAPLCREREGRLPSVRTIRFLGTERVSSEYLDLIVDPEREDEAAAALLDAVVDAGRDWERLALTDLLEDSVLLRRWGAALEARGYAARREPREDCPYLPLPADAVAFWRERSPTLRAAVRRAGRKLDGAGFRHRLEQGSSLPAALERLYALHGARWAARGRTGNFVDPRVRAFHHDLARMDGDGPRPWIGTLSRDGRDAAMLYLLEWGGTVSYYQSAFDVVEPPDVHPYRPGLVLLGRSLEDAIASRAREFDFLRGLEPYKFRWTERVRRTWSLVAIRPDAWSARGRDGLGRWVKRAKRGVRRLIGSGAVTVR